MPFTISVKKASPNVSSNKHQTLCHKDDPKPVQQLSLEKAPFPSIDRLTLTLTVPTEQAGKDMWTGLWTAINTVGVFSKGKTSKGFKSGHRMSLPSIYDSKKWPHFEVNWQDQMITKLRLDFVPADLGYDGLVELHAVLTGLMDGGWAYMVKHGRISRIDLALDFPNASMNEFHFLPVQGATSASWKQSGALQSFQHGKSRGNCTMIYDRGAKRTAQGKGGQGKVGVRVERRLRNLTTRLHELPSMPNPFASMNMVKRVVEPPPSETKQAYIWLLFMDAAEKSGLPAALAKLPVKKRTAYRKHLAKHLQPWWDADASWAEWPNMLAELKIAAANAW